MGNLSGSSVNPKYGLQRLNLCVFPPTPVHLLELVCLRLALYVGERWGVTRVCRLRSLHSEHSLVLCDLRNCDFTVIIRKLHLAGGGKKSEKPPVTGPKTCKKAYFYYKKVDFLITSLKNIDNYPEKL